MCNDLLITTFMHDTGSHMRIPINGLVTAHASVLSVTSQKRATPLGWLRLDADVLLQAAQVTATPSTQLTSGKSVTSYQAGR